MIKNKRETQKCKQKGTANTVGAREARAPPVLLGTFLITFLSFALIFYYNYCNNYNL